MASFRDVAVALGLESGAPADQCLEAIATLKAKAETPVVISGHAPGTFLSLVKISAGDTKIAPGDVLPFDPTNPPNGFNGFVEGVHYRRAG